MQITRKIGLLFYPVADYHSIMPTKPLAIYRTDLLLHGMNAGKETRVRALLRVWRSVAVAQSREQWRLVFTTGHPSKRHDVSRTGYDLIGTSYGQMVRWQVVGQIQSWLSNRANDFRDLVNRSSLPPDVKHALHFINTRHAWYDPDSLTLKDGSEILAQTRTLARTLFRHLLKRHRKPDLRKVSMMIDQRGVTLAKASRATAFPWWARLSTLDRGQPVSVPLLGYDHFAERKGPKALSVQVIERDGDLVFGVMTDMAETFAASRAAYRPRIESIALDLGLKTLFATDRGDLLGRGWLDQLRAHDARITKLAAYRQRHGLKTRSPRYKAAVARLRGLIRTEVGRVLNRLVDVHAPAQIVVERLDLRNPNLSRRLNRILSHFGKREVTRKLQDLHDRLGIETVKVNPAYSSQAHTSCGYVDVKNRPRQAHFRCLWCGATRHADVNAARNLLRRRSDAVLGDCRRPKQAILGELVRRFSERFPRLKDWPPDPRRHNPYFRDWVGAVTSSVRPG